jgi:putative phosphoribosyl transferase
VSFRDRSDAGRRLADKVVALGLEHPVVLGMARGGVPVAAELSRALRAPLDVLVVRKLGYPPQPELAMGAIGEGGVRVLNDHVIDQLGVPRSVIERVAAAERRELERRLAAYRAGRAAVAVAGRTVVVVDDGLATGATARAALAVVRGRGAAKVVVAAPVAPPAVVQALGAEADEVVCVEVSERFFGIGQWYDDFHQVSDDEVRRILAEAATGDTVAGAAVPEGPRPAHEVERAEVVVPADGVGLPGYLTIPAGAGAGALVVFAHGSGSGRDSPRNQEVAAALHQAGLATLLFDLLTPSEAEDRTNVFDVGLLARRLEAAVSWARRQERLGPGEVGLFGASTGAAAALVVAAAGPGVAAVVSRGGRPDLVPPSELARVGAPTLLVVGSEDRAVLEANRRALRSLANGALEVVAGAGHLFEEPGALAEVGRLATDWFVRHLGAGPAPGRAEGP